MTRFCNAVLNATVLPGKLAGWLVLPLVFFVCLSVFAAQYGWNAFARWETAIPVFGQGITVNTLTDMQWYIFAILSVFGGVYAYRDNQHVSVDVFSSALPPRVQLGLQVFGDLVFLLPFCAIIAWYGWSFTMASFNSGEGSTYGGLMDRWLIKAIMPIGFALLGIAGLARAIRTMGEIVRPAETPEKSSSK